MIAFQVSDMTTTRCAGAVTKALKAVDHAAVVKVDLATFTVEIELMYHDGDSLDPADWRTARVVEEVTGDDGEIEHVKATVPRDGMRRFVRLRVEVPD